MGTICLGSNDSRIIQHTRAKFGCSQTVLSKKGGGVQTDTHTQRDTPALYSRLAGYPASLGPLPLCLLPCLPPSSPPLPLSILGLPGFAHNICVLVQDNCFPQSYFEIWTSKIPHRGVNFVIDLSTVHDISRSFGLFYP